jgi:hypothetical protein
MAETEAQEQVLAYLPQPGELGLGVGRAFAEEFESVVWFPMWERAAAEELVAESEGRWSLKEGVRF